MSRVRNVVAVIKKKRAIFPNQAGDPSPMADRQFEQTPSVGERPTDCRTRPRRNRTDSRRQTRNARVDNF